MGYLKSIGTVIIYIGFFLTVITFLPGIPPEVEVSEYSIKYPNTQTEFKSRLEEIQILFSGEVNGPEDFASFNGKIYTGIHGGYVVQIEENLIKPLVKFGQKCDGLWQEEKCGRPLGLKFNDKGELFVNDAYYGIFKVNINTREYINIVNSSEPIDGKIPKIINSLDIAKNGDIYWTDSSTDFYLYDGMYSILANPSGRLIRYNAATKKNEVLLKNLGFANGVILSDDESFVIVSETTNSRIIKYNLKGSKAGQQEIFAEGLPGVPDNINSDKQGGFLVSLIILIDSNNPYLIQSLIPHPYIRKMLLRLFYLIEAPFKLLQDIYPNYYSERILHALGSLNIAKCIQPNRTSVILRMDKTGKILDTLLMKNVSDISSAYIYNGYLWLGSPWNEYIIRVSLKQVFPDLADNNMKSLDTKEEKQEKPFLTVSATPNVKIEAKSTKVTAKQEEVIKSSLKSTIKAQTTQKSNLDATIPKSTTPKSINQQSSSVSSKTSSSSSSKTSKEVMKDNLKIEKDDSKEIKKDNFNSQIKSETLKKASNEIKKDNSKTKHEIPNKNNEAKMKSNQPVKKDIYETQFGKSKLVKKDDNSNKK